MKINKLKLAVAGAVLATASVANAGIIIPAGEWTIDINGNVNAFANYTHANAASGGGVATGGIAAGANAMNANSTNPNKYLGINTGLLPAWLGFTGTTRQNDLDVSWTISFQPNTSDNALGGDVLTPLNRQAFLTFGDKSWGSIKLGKDIGIFGSDAILNDMTLLGVGGGAGRSGAQTTFGGIGTGYVYAAWKGQVSYTTPNFNGLQASVGIFNPNGDQLGVGSSATTTLVTANQDRFGVEAKASYSFAADGFSGKVWAEGATYDVTPGPLNGTNSTATYTISAGGAGAHVDAGPIGVTGYAYSGSGLGTTRFGLYGVYQATAASAAKRDSDGGYIQLTYATPFKTKVGVAYGISNLDTANAADAAANGTLVKENERVTVGLYHPLTKHLNLVAEYNNINSKAQNNGTNESNTYSAGAILFF